MSAPQAQTSSKHGSLTDWLSVLGQRRTSTIALSSLAGLILLATLVALCVAGKTSDPLIPRLSPSFFFWLEVGYLLLLLVVAALYVLTWNYAQPLLLGGVLPIGVPWFGALGAVVISLEGIFAFAHRGWDARYSYWHIGRPLFGAVLGIVAFFTYVLIIISSGSLPAFLTGGIDATKPKDYIIYYVVAFVVGYREETFRELIRRVTDLILKPSAAAPATPALAFKQGGAIVTVLNFGRVEAGTSKSLTVSAENTGKGSLQSPVVTIEGSASTDFAVVNSQLAGVSELKPGEAKTFDVTFTPKSGGASNATLALTGANLSSAAKLPITGNA